MTLGRQRRYSRSSTGARHAGNPYSDLAYNCLPYYAPIRGVAFVGTIRDFGYPERRGLRRALLQVARLSEIPHWNFISSVAVPSRRYCPRRLLPDCRATPTKDALALGSQCRDRATVAWELVQKGGK